MRKIIESTLVSADGVIGDPPEWTSRMASSKRADAVRLSRYPLAPALSELKSESLSS